MIKPCDVQQPTPEMISKSRAKLLDVYKGIVPEAQFWMMQKMNIDMSNGDKLDKPSSLLMQRALQSI